MYYAKVTQQRKLYVQPEAFLKDACEYFVWCESHPLQEEQVAFHKIKDGVGEDAREHIQVSRAGKARMRPFTRMGLATHLGIPVSRLSGYTARGGGWAEAMEMIEQIIYTQKFEGAAAGLLNATIISRDLGLAEKQEVAAEVVDLTPRVEATPEDHHAIHVHPDDPDPTGVMTGVLPRMLFSSAQLNAGMAFPSG